MRGKEKQNKKKGELWFMRKNIYKKGKISNTVEENIKS